MNLHLLVWREDERWLLDPVNRWFAYGGDENTIAGGITRQTVLDALLVMRDAGRRASVDVYALADEATGWQW